MALLDESYANILVTTNDNKIGLEKRFKLNLNIQTLTEKLELITGIDHNDMKIIINIDDKKLTDINCNENLDKLIVNYIDHTLLSIDKSINFHVISVSGKSIVNFENSDINDRFKLSEEEYEKRQDSVLAWKMRNKLGRFNESQQNECGDQIDQLTQDNVGKRCKVKVKNTPTRLATIRFIGETHFKPGQWIGVEYDEPLGKNDGSVEGKRYFDCKPKYGGFVISRDIEIGDYDKEDYGLDDLEEL